MMKNFIRASVSKRVFTKVFAHLARVEKAIETIVKTYDTDTQLTLLLKLGNAYNVDKRLAQEKNNELKTNWKNLLGPKTKFGFFNNSEIGAIFIAGPLSELFLHDIDGKKLGELTEAPYGISRGLGIPEIEAPKDIKKLNEGQYLLLIRTSRLDRNDWKNVLEETG